ncbi:MAG: glutathione S-transferase [Thiobacillaceae bacterium]|nr:glutathione S-transferase [Thiobacillaceae bacterium]MCX7673995.1 glutathione S-transferase [Thiobacillaceae bacterium]MDW8322777.1 glutathione S-transferase [Burkholderiales bacterium]
MKLIASLTSPFARKVRVVAAEKHIDYELVVDIPWDEDTRVPQYNPLGKVPVWVLEDGKTLFDSRVIVEYLDSISPVGHVLPREPRPRIMVKRWEALADGLCEAAATVFQERKRPPQQQSAEWIARQMRKVDAALTAMSEDLGEQEWCTGEFFNLSDIATGCALGYLDLRFPELDWRSRHPNLAALHERLLARPSFRDTLPPAA